MQLQASLMSCFVCLTSISVFLHVNFLLKGGAMILAAATHVAFYLGCLMGEGEGQQR